MPFEAFIAGKHHSSGRRGRGGHTGTAYRLELAFPNRTWSIANTFRSMAKIARRGENEHVNKKLDFCLGFSLSIYCFLYVYFYLLVT